MGRLVLSGMHELLHPGRSYPWATEISVRIPEIITSQILDAVKQGKRPSIDDPSCWLSKLMIRCWNQDPNQRPSSSQLKESFDTYFASILSEVGIYKCILFNS